jgi:hypothetical protein
MCLSVAAFGVLHSDCSGLTIVVGYRLCRVVVCRLCVTQYIGNEFDQKVALVLELVRPKPELGVHSLDIITMRTPDDDVKVVSVLLWTDCTTDSSHSTQSVASLLPFTHLPHTHIHTHTHTSSPPRLSSRSGSALSASVLLMKDSCWVVSATGRFNFLFSIVFRLLN